MAKVLPSQPASDSDIKRGRSAIGQNLRNETDAQNSADFINTSIRLEETRFTYSLRCFQSLQVLVMGSEQRNPAHTLDQVNTADIPSIPGNLVELGWVLRMVL